jgi:hypothetical protein|tara:strand:- start:326 stop:703 length:378 start_codon:yes stop_codon:yes gene_type:complete
MEINYARTYKSAKGNTVFVYTVTGNATELADYERVQGSYHRVDPKTGETLWFTTRFVGESGSLIITDNNKVVADMSEFDKQASLVQQYGGNLGDHLAKSAADKLMTSKSTAKAAGTPAGNNIGDL